MENNPEIICKKHMYNKTLVKKISMDHLLCTKYQQFICENRYIKNYFFKNNVCTFFLDKNSDTALMYILKNVSVNPYIRSFEREKPFIVNHVNHVIYRTDIYLKLFTSELKYIDVVIEIDESHHFNHSNKAINNDNIKDKYYIEKGYSILHIVVKIK